jgi:sugar/nucleoside kinase (ribokinase family)
MRRKTFGWDSLRDHHAGRERIASYLTARNSIEHVAPFPVTSIDSTGAGDAFIGSFAVFLAEGATEREAVRRANLYAALSTTGVGMQKSFYDRARFEAELSSRGIENVSSKISS